MFLQQRPAPLHPLPLTKQINYIFWSRRKKEMKRKSPYVFILLPVIWCFGIALCFSSLFYCRREKKILSLKSKPTRQGYLSFIRLISRRACSSVFLDFSSISRQQIAFQAQFDFSQPIYQFSITADF